MSEPIVLSQIETTNFDLLRLLNGGTVDSKGGLFSLRTIKTWESKTKAGRPMHGLVFQIITNGIDNPVKRQDVIIKKVKGDTIIKEKIVKVKPKEEQVKFDIGEDSEVLF